MIWEYEVYYLKVSILTPVKTSQTNSDTLHKFPFAYLEKKPNDDIVFIYKKMNVLI